MKKEEYQVILSTRLAELLLINIPERHREVAEGWSDAMFRKVKGELALNRDGTPIIKNYLILVNAKTKELTYELQDGDEVAVLPPFGGG